MTSAVKDIPGFEGLYAVSKSGEVWSHAKKYGANNSLRHAGLWLKPYRHYKGYLLVHLRGHMSCRIHRLVALTYLPNPKGLSQVNHKNGIKHDNRLSNLEWCSASDNVKHFVAKLKGKARIERAFAKVSP